jgi:hypothetical protein
MLYEYSNDTPSGKKREKSQKPHSATADPACRQAGFGLKSEGCSPRLVSGGEMRGSISLRRGMRERKI